MSFLDYDRKSGFKECELFDVYAYRVGVSYPLCEAPLAGHTVIPKCPIINANSNSSKKLRFVVHILFMGSDPNVFIGKLAATAILDRVVHHCHILSITGDSYRVKGSKYSVKEKEQFK